MELVFRIPDLQLEITIKGGSTRFFGLLLLMECFLHYMRCRGLIAMSRRNSVLEESSSDYACMQTHFTSDAA